MEYVFTIRSYKRAKTLQHKSLAFLEKHGVSPSKVFIFVANEEELASYKESLPEIWHTRLQVGVPLGHKVNNFIHKFFPAGTRVVSMDDDITDIVHAKDKKLSPVKDLNRVICAAFSWCDTSGTKLWGISPTSNAFFMDDGISFNLKFCVGCFWGFIAGDYDIEVHQDPKEDYERTILYYKKYGSVVRMNMLAPITNYYKEKGGLQEYRTNDIEKKAYEYMLETYPLFCSPNLRRKSEYPQILLRDKRKKHG